MVEKTKRNLVDLVNRNFDLWSWPDHKRLTYLAEQRAQLKLRIDALGPRTQRRQELEAMQRVLTLEQLKLEVRVSDGPRGVAG